MELNNCSLEAWASNEEAYLKLLENEDSCSKIPLINVSELHQIQDKSLVRFRGMIQDMYGPEYYLEKYEVFDKTINEKIVKSGKYYDVINQVDNVEVELNNENNVTSERHVFVAISVPAVNDWVKNIENEKFKLSNTANVITNTQTKRSYEDQEESDIEMKDSHKPAETISKQKKQRFETNPSASTRISTRVVSEEHMLNFPVPNATGKGCMLKLYKDCDIVKLNDVYEFVGFLSVDPVLAEPFINDEEENDNAMEIQTHYPPASLIPRIHCVKFTKMEHNNPLDIASFENTEIVFSTIRKDLQIVLTQLLLGDELAAEYLILHLISIIYHRRDLVVLGKFTLNISRVPSIKEVNYVSELYQFVELLVPKSHYLPMTLENMNTLAFIPKKDYDCNRLTSGILQLSANTHLVLDETKLCNGKLNQAGIDNIKAINCIIKDQKISYDFNYYRLDYLCDIPILIFSEGKSLFNSDFHVPLQPDSDHVNTFKEIVQVAKHFLDSQLLNKIRIYLTLARLTDYELSGDMQKLVQEEFVTMRQNNKSVTADDLHSLLVLARVVCLSYGKCTLDEECWKIACNLERNRKIRLGV